MFKGLVIVVLISVLSVLAIGAYLTPDDLATCEQQPNNRVICEKADAIVAVSGGSTTLRAGEAIKLYKNGWADKLIFSGAALDENSPSNASVMRQQALREGVPESAILVDETSRTTHENAAQTAQILQNNQIQRLIVVTSPYHQRRTSLEFEQIAGNTTIIINHPVQNDPDWPKHWWITPRGWWLAIGEMAKIIINQTGDR